jgi:hypothetical protein
MEAVLWLIVWFIASVISVNRMDQALRVYILDYEIKRPKILKTIIIAMIWMAITIGVLYQVLR